jgi:hypothetical protein
LARGDGLVVADQHLSDIAADFGRHGHAVGLQEGVVGTFDEAPDQPPLPGPQRRSDQGDDQ